MRTGSSSRSQAATMRTRSGSQSGMLRRSTEPEYISLIHLELVQNVQLALAGHDLSTLSTAERDQVYEILKQRVHLLGVKEVETVVQTSIDRGLSCGTPAERRAVFGPNQYASP
eukprot:c32290_g1_i1.p1 GENE.c32290_g1_i1~~c32290_g1_i1.p1  ORF type:complete len:114 (+),score=4.84 c32290_g1_i1:689-1030(+)